MKIRISDIEIRNKFKIIKKRRKPWILDSKAKLPW